MEGKCSINMREGVADDVDAVEEEEEEEERVRPR